MKVKNNLIYLFISIFFFLNIFLIIDRREIDFKNLKNFKVEFIHLFGRSNNDLNVVTKENKQIISMDYFSQTLSYIIEENKKFKEEVAVEFLNYEPVEESTFIFSMYPIKEGFSRLSNSKKYLIAKSKVDYEEFLFFVNLESYKNYDCKILLLDNITKNILRKNILKNQKKYLKSLVSVDHLKNRKFIKVIYECF